MVQSDIIIRTPTHMAQQGGGGQGEGQADGGGDEKDSARHHILRLEVADILATSVLEYQEAGITDISITVF